jgi:acyl carrier protein
MATAIKEKQIVSGIKKIIAEKFGLNENEIRSDANFQDDLGVDSLDIIELHMAIEKEFKLKIEDEEAEKMKTINAVIELIEKKLSYQHY